MQCSLYEWILLSSFFFFFFYFIPCLESLIVMVNLYSGYHPIQFNEQIRLI